MKNDTYQYSICISGAAAGETVELDSDLAYRLGQAIAHSGHIITSGATVGLPFFAAKGAKEAGGMSVGFSPANSVREHLRKYRLPYEYFDFINYTGMAYVGRDLYLVQSSDAVIQIGGRMGSMHEFTSALEARKPVGVLLGSHGAADLIPQLMEILEPPSHALVVYDDNPEKLVAKIVAILDKEYADIQASIKNGNEHWYLNKLGSSINRAG